VVQRKLGAYDENYTHLQQGLFEALPGAADRPLSASDIDAAIARALGLTSCPHSVPAHAARTLCLQQCLHTYCLHIYCPHCPPDACPLLTHGAAALCLLAHGAAATLCVHDRHEPSSAKRRPNPSWAGARPRPISHLPTMASARRSSHRSSHLTERTTMTRCSWWMSPLDGTLTSPTPYPLTSSRALSLSSDEPSPYPLTSPLPIL
jgi:hypothetical protein